MDVKRASSRYIYRFGQGQAEGDGSMREELGGKGAALAEMTRLGLPVPPGFTISTSVCKFYLEHGTMPESLDDEMESALRWLELEQAQRLGSEKDPLLLSVRSGAPLSMPGMMDTILNVGINDSNIAVLAAKHQNMEFALDSYRRLLQMFGSVVLRIPKQAFDRASEDAKAVLNPSIDLADSTIVRTIASFHQVIEQISGSPFPMDPREQLGRRWRRYSNPGTMIALDTTGVSTVSARNPNGGYGTSDGLRELWIQQRNRSWVHRAIPRPESVRCLPNFSRTRKGKTLWPESAPLCPSASSGERCPGLSYSSASVTSKLETHYRDVQDFEFTVQKGELFLLQTRSARCSALAKIRTAVEMAEEGLIGRKKRCAAFRLN